jgi:hypothetical protein
MLSLVSLRRRRHLTTPPGPHQPNDFQTLRNQAIAEREANEFLAAAPLRCAFADRT